MPLASQSLMAAHGGQSGYRIPDTGYQLRGAGIAAPNYSCYCSNRFDEAFGALEAIQ